MMMIEANMLTDLNFFAKLYVHRLAELYMNCANSTGAYAVVMDQGHVFLVPADYKETPENKNRFSEDAVIFRPEVC